MMATNISSLVETYSRLVQTPEHALLLIAVAEEGGTSYNCIKCWQRKRKT